MSDREGQDSMRGWDLHMNALQGQPKSSGDLFNDGREVGFSKELEGWLIEHRLVVASRIQKMGDSTGWPNLRRYLSFDYILSYLSCYRARYPDYFSTYSSC